MKLEVSPNSPGDFLLRACRIGFLIAVALAAFGWSQFTPESRFYFVFLAAVGFFVLVSSDTFDSLCRKLLTFGCMAVVFSVFTLLTGYHLGWRTPHPVEPSSAVPSFVLGLFIVAIAIGAKKYARGN